MIIRNKHVDHNRGRLGLTTRRRRPPRGPDEGANLAGSSWYSRALGEGGALLAGHGVEALGGVPVPPPHPQEGSCARGESLRVAVNVPVR